MSTTSLVFTVLGAIVLAGWTIAYLSIRAIEKDSQINQAEPEPCDLCSEDSTRLCPVCDQSTLET